jgi:hypothetical protein
VVKISPIVVADPPLFARHASATARALSASAL